jgi:hypothetical protein
MTNANENKVDVAGSTTLVNSAAGAAGMLAGWAMSSLGKKVWSFLNPILSLTGPACHIRSANCYKWSFQPKV